MRHGHFRVNGHKVNIPSFLCRANDIVDVKEGSKKVTRILESLGAVDRRGVPKWLELDKDAFKGRLTSLPSREDLTLPIREQLIVELYSQIVGFDRRLDQATRLGLIGDRNGNG